MGAPLFYAAIAATAALRAQSAAAVRCSARLLHDARNRRQLAMLLRLEAHALRALTPRKHTA